MYDILSLTNSTLITADTILLCTKINLNLIHDFHSFFHRKMCVLLLVQFHCPPICPAVSPLDLPYISIVLFILSLANLPYTQWRHFRSRISYPYSLTKVFYLKNLSRSYACNMLILRWRTVSPTPNPKAGGPPLVVCLWLLIQCICSYSQ
jgi:hypothetical protein